MVTTNNLRKTRVEQGLSITELSRLSDVSVTMIRDIETFSKEGSEKIKHRLVNGLNANPRRTREITFEEVFPNN
jgi:transcriptional regulator with XRE-family HTH domain